MSSDKIRYLGYYFKYKDKIYSYFWYRTGGKKELAEDLTQDVFLKVWKEFGSFMESRSFQSWVYMIAHNRLVDFYRGQKLEVELDQVHAVPQKKDLSWELWLMLNDLPEKDREIISLKYLHGFSYKEIGEITSQSEGAARIMAHRALKKLKIKTYDDKR